MNLLILMLRLNKQVNLFDGIADVIYFKLGNDCLPCLLLCYYVCLMLFLRSLKFMGLRVNYLSIYLYKNPTEEIEDDI